MPKIATFCPKITHPYSPTLPWNLETFLYLLLICIIHDHFQEWLTAQVTNFVPKLPIFSNLHGMMSCPIFNPSNLCYAPKPTPTHPNTFQNIFF